jgi:hypothetical protein
MDMSNLDKKTPDSLLDRTLNDHEIRTTDTRHCELATISIPGVDSVFEEQAALVNHAVQVIGMGKYQWALFALAGYGWMCDQVSIYHPSTLLDLFS